MIRPGDIIGGAALAVALVASLWIGWATVTPCQTEDSNWCAWDASAQGNGQGQSFIALGPVTLYP